VTPSNDYLLHRLYHLRSVAEAVCVPRDDPCPPAYTEQEWAVIQRSRRELERKQYMESFGPEESASVHSIIHRLIVLLERG
jgi:hypothetical protein